MYTNLPENSETLYMCYSITCNVSTFMKIYMYYRYYDKNYCKHSRKTRKNKIDCDKKLLKTTLANELSVVVSYKMKDTTKLLNLPVDWRRRDHIQWSC